MVLAGGQKSSGGQVNPQTWTRLKRIELRKLANDVGNEALLIHDKWPRSGEGRAIKSATESISRRLDGLQQTGTLQSAFGELTSAANYFAAILQNKFFQAEMAGKPIKRRRGDRSTMGQLINSASSDVLAYIENYEFPVETSRDHLRELERVIPTQKIGPIQFEYVSSVLRVKHAGAMPEDADKANVESAIKALRKTAKQISVELTNSNCDRRLLAVTDDLVARLKSRQDIVQLGLANIAAQMVFDSSKQEVPDLLFAQLQAFSISLSMYVAQFPEWARFSENAAMAEFTPADVKGVYQAGSKLVQDLEGAQKAVDSEVPRTLRWMLETIRNPRLATKRTVFAAIRTIENLVSIMLKSFGEVLVSIKDGTTKGVKLATAGIVATALLVAAADAAKGVSPAAARILQTHWLSKAADIVLKKLLPE